MRKAVLDFYRETLASRLNNKKDGVIILLMQRLHEQDLAGTLIAAGGWDELTLPAIAPCDADIPIGKGKVHHRKMGEVLDPAREPYETLMGIRRDLGPAVFSAQYLCAPLPDEGAMIRRDWLRYYDGPLEREPGDIILQSWDCANTVSEASDWSVGLTFLVRGDQIYLIGHCRARLLFPILKARVEQEVEHFKPSILLVEDAAAGQQLIQVFNDNAPPGFPTIYPVKPKGDKPNRVARATLEIERGHLFLPNEAAYLPALQTEMLSFPQSLHDDQVDALAQALNFLAERRLLGNIVPLENMRISPWFGDRGSDNEFYDPKDDPDEISEEDM